MTAHAEVRAGLVIEGALGEVALADVLQLLDLGRKTGALELRDPFGTARACVVLVSGRVCGASVDREHAASDASMLRRATSASADEVRDVVLELLGWTDGRFAVAPLPEGVADATRASFGVDALLMEAARRADEWAALADRVPGAHVVPQLADAGASAARDDALALTPGEWQLLALADGAADLRALAARAGRDALSIGRDVHRLLGEGLLALVDVPRGGHRSSI